MNQIVTVKTCSICKLPKPLPEFYKRSQVTTVSRPEDVLGRCIKCMKLLSATQGKLSPTEPRALSDKLAITYLHQHGISSLPGKAFSAAHVDVLAWGCVRIEVKYSHQYDDGLFVFALTPKQKVKGLLADIVMLICDYGASKSYHFFFPDEPFFYYLDGRQKQNLSFSPSRIEQKKFMSTRVVLTQPVMSAAENRIEIIEEVRCSISRQLIADS